MPSIYNAENSILTTISKLGTNYSEVIQPGGEICIEREDDVITGWQRCCTTNDTGAPARLMRPLMGLNMGSWVSEKNGARTGARRRCTEDSAKL